MVVGSTNVMRDSASRRIAHGERGEHRQRAEAERHPAEPLGGLQQPEIAEDVVPVVQRAVGQQRQCHRATVGDVDRDVGETLARPEQRDRRRAVLAAREEHAGADRGHEHLIE
jgi:hypothetical protein